MIKTMVCRLLDIEYPIIQGGMGWISSAKLAAAVSNAGGLGTLSPIYGEQKNWPNYLREQIREANRLTQKPFGVNISLEFEPAITEQIMNVIIEEKVKVVTTAMGSPSFFVKRFQGANIKVMHLVFSPRHARRAEAEGVDAVVASGVDAGGHLSQMEIPTFALVPQVVDAVKIPVIAAGGIADGRGLVAALALGAEGIQMGTRFVATKECPAHPGYKEMILKGRAEDTVVTGRGSRVEARVLKNDLATKVLEMDRSGASEEEIYNFIGPGRVRMAALEGNLREGSLMCGAAVGLINEELSVQEVIQHIVQEASALLGTLRLLGERGEI